MSAAYLYARPDFTRGAAFLFGDEGANLLVAHELHEGRALYTEVAFPYGPVGIELYAAIGAVLGNTPTVYLSAMAVLSAAAVAMVAALVRRNAGATVTAACVVVGLLPTMALPGASIGGYTSSIYMPLERIALLAAVLLWILPWHRSLSRSIALGAVLGLCQGIRFGSGPVVLAATVLVDQAASICRGRAGERRRALVASAGVVAGFLLSACAWIAWAVLTLPAGQALEFLWPLQMWETHRVAVGVPRWPTWGGWRMGVTQYAMPATAGLLSIASFVRWLRTGHEVTTGRPDRRGAVFILLASYGIGCVLFFRHEHHFRQFAWMLVPAAIPTLIRWAPGYRAALLVLCAPAVWPLGSALAQPRSSAIVRLEVPRGYAVFVSRSIAERVGVLAPFTRAGPVMFVPNGAGWLYAFDVEHVSRHTWFYSRAVVRPFEEASFNRAAAGAAIVIRCGTPVGPADWPLPAATLELFGTYYRPIASGGGCEVLGATAGVSERSR